MDATYHALDLVQQPLGVQQPNGVARNQAAERVSDDAQLLDLAAPALDNLQLLLDLDADPLAAQLDAIVRKAAAVALRHENVQLRGRVLLTQGLRDVGQMVGVPPELWYERCAMSSVFAVDPDVVVVVVVVVRRGILKESTYTVDQDTEMLRFRCSPRELFGGWSGHGVRETIRDASMAVRVL